MQRIEGRHRDPCRYVQSYVKPGMKMTEICQRLERKTHELVMANGLEAGWGFPLAPWKYDGIMYHYVMRYRLELVFLRLLAQLGPVLSSQMGFLTQSFRWRHTTRRTTGTKQ